MRHDPRAVCLRRLARVSPGMGAVGPDALRPDAHGGAERMTVGAMMLWLDARCETHAEWSFWVHVYVGLRIEEETW